MTKLYKLGIALNLVDVLLMLIRLWAYINDQDTCTNLRHDMLFCCLSITTITSAIVPVRNLQQHDLS
jgi:hypothetical protein